MGTIFQNDNGFFSEVSLNIGFHHYRNITLGDYDNDGDLDLLSLERNQFKVYRNDGLDGYSEILSNNSFVELNGGSWTDYDSDGDLDLALSGHHLDDQVNVFFLRNENSDSFVQDPMKIDGITGTVNPCDYDNDGDVDYFIHGKDIDENVSSGLYINRYPKEFLLSSNEFSAGVTGTADWADFNEDGYADIFVSSSGIHKLTDDQNGFYVNQNDTFQYLPITVGGSYYSDGIFGDFDVDGDIDYLFFSGNFFSLDIPTVSRLYSNLGSNKFLPTDSIFNIWQVCRIACSDYDNDGDLDLFRSGRINNESNSSYYNLNEFLLNNSTEKNLPPDSPEGLETSIIDKTATLRWKLSMDDLTDSKGLSYNIRVGTTLEGIDIMSPMADLESGNRRIPQLGNAFFDTTWVLKDLIPGKYYWQVQAIDNSYLGSPFSDIDSFIIEPDFTTGHSFNPLQGSCLAWGDFDGDNDLDYVITGGRGVPGGDKIYTSEIYRNDGSEFSLVFEGNDSVRDCSVSWGDYDNDNDLDLIIAGSKAIRQDITDNSWRYESTTVVKLFTNNGSSFAESTLDVDLKLFNELFHADYTAWGDCDNDGDLDLLISGINFTQIHENIGNGTFKAFSSFRAGGKAAWGDIDNDLDLDIVCQTGIYENLGKNVFQHQQNLLDMELISFSYNNKLYDFNNDGFLDLLTTYLSQDGKRKTLLYNNQLRQSGKFVIEECGIRATYTGAVSIGDYNNDGVSDVFISNIEGNQSNRLYLSSKEYQILTTDHHLPDSIGGTKIAWGNYDNDSDLDLLITGVVYGAGEYFRVLRNNGNWPNDPPEAPLNLISELSDYGVMFSWDQALDQQSVQGGLSYNIRVGTTPGGCDLVSPMSDPVTGYRRITELGNTQMNAAWKIDSLPVGKYYWSVQAIDQSFAGGSWAPEDSFIIESINVDFDPDTACQGMPVLFIDRSVIRGESVDSWVWDFGDGGSSTEKNPQYIFLTKGGHDITLQVTRGEEGYSKSKQIYLKSSPKADFETEEVCIGEFTSFTNTSSSEGISTISWHWDFGDGITSSAQNPQPHGFVNPGTYNVSLSATADNGCSDTIQKVVSVLSKPDGQITEEGTMCVDPGYQLKTIEAPGYTYQWKYAGTNLPGAKEASYSPDLPGNYSVVVNSQCGEVSASYTVEKPELSIVENGTPCKDADYTLATQQYASYSYQWKYQGIDIPEATQSTYQPDNEGEYTVEVQTPCGEVSASHTIEAPSYYIITEGIPCKGSNFVLKTEDWAANSYQWKYQGVSIEGATKAIYYPGRPGDYSVDIQTPCGLYSADYNVAFITGPAKPDVYIRGPKVWYLACSNDSADEYQWYRDGNLIEGASDPVYIPDQQLGMYQVRISNGGECFTGSDPVYLPGSFTGIDDDPFANLKIYPNPTPGVFNIEMDNPIMGELLIDIFTEQGSKVINIKFMKETSHFVAQVDWSGQGEGLYLINIELDQYSTERKIVVNE
ncbi:MAG: FG-GAP-like repeat-containing protein [Bacteroidota bacterium]